jgi:hypothetical protein
MRRLLITAAIGLPTALTLTLGSAAASSLHITHDLVGATFEIAVPTCAEESADGQPTITWTPGRDCSTGHLAPTAGDDTPLSGEDAPPETGDATHPTPEGATGDEPMPPPEPGDDEANADTGQQPPPSDPPGELPGADEGSDDAGTSDTEEPTDDAPTTEAPEPTESRPPA